MLSDIGDVGEVCFQQTNSLECELLACGMVPRIGDVKKLKTRGLMQETWEVS